MTLIDWVAVFGALAWLPPIVEAMRNYASRAKIRIITENKAEVGFTTFGPIVNLRLAFVVDRKDIVVQDLGFVLRHESGEERQFKWQGLTHKMLQMQNPETGPIPFEKESNVLALKLNTKDVEERFIKFQEPSFHSKREPHELKARKKIGYLLQAENDPVEKFIRTEEFLELVSFNGQAFGWKPGTYELRFILTAPDSYELLDAEYTFTLSPNDVVELERNKSCLAKEYTNQANGYQKDKMEKFAWVWAYPRLTKKKAD